MVSAQILSHAGPASAGHLHDASTGFWERPFVQNFVPFLTSLSLHAAILIVGLLFFKVIQRSNEPSQIQVLVPTTDVVDQQKMPGYEGTANQPLLQSMQDQTHENTDPNGKNFDPSSLKSLQASGGGSNSDESSVIAVGASASTFSHNSGRNGIGKGSGADEGDGGMAPMWGPTQRGGAPGFCQIPSGGAHKIVFLCDASGSMINKMASLKMELSKAIASLKPTQSFSVIFFQDGPRPDMLSASLLPATPQNKRKAEAFLEGIVPTGTTDPLPGLDAAFRQQPELIYLLTDGDFPDNDAVLSKVRGLKAGHGVKINTIAFVGSGDSDTAFIDLLKTVAKENGGTYRHVSEDDLGR